MTLIKRITDKDILGIEGLSNAKPRYTARAILKNRDDQYAVMYAGAFHLYSLPGGGIEQDESVIEALKRMEGRVIIQTMFMKGRSEEGYDVDNTTDDYVLPWIEAVKQILTGIMIRDVLQHIGIKAVEHHSVGKIVLFNQFHTLFDTFAT